MQFVDRAFELESELSKPEAYIQDPTERVELIETHISWVFLTDAFAYKVKKPIVNDFIDYQALDRRKFYCEKEIELDSRYAPQLYVGVVPICRSGQALVVEADGTPVEYAVKMRRFQADALLSHRLSKNLVDATQIDTLAQLIAAFHQRAAISCDANEGYGSPARVLNDQLQNLDALQASEFNSSQDRLTLDALRRWTGDEFKRHQLDFVRRKETGWVRECHGDLHAGNIVLWDNQLTPFDGVEFNEGFRWIDTLSDFAFLAMDLCIRGREPLSHQLISSYFEALGDYSALGILRWYLVYRALVRAKVASIVLSQHERTSDLFEAAHQERSQLLKYAVEKTRTTQPRLSIMHGLSGSGKSTHAANIVRDEAAIRIRADVERKRLLGLQPLERLLADSSHALYSPEMTNRTYARLRDVADAALSAGLSVVVDATFLKHLQRERFAELARSRGVDFRIVDCQAEANVLKQRILRRQGTDASDADINVLQLQTENQEPLTPAEQRFAMNASQSNA